MNDCVRHGALRGQTAVSLQDLLCPSCSGCSRAASGAPKDKEPLKKAKTPQGRFDSSEETRKDVLESEDDDLVVGVGVVTITAA